MERSKKPKPLWRKVTPGTLRIHIGASAVRTRIKPKQTIAATEDEIGKWLIHFELVDKPKSEVVDKEEGEKETTPSTPVSDNEEGDKSDDQDTLASIEGDTYEIETIGGGWFNVVSAAGKVMNDTSLRAEAAKELKESLEEETPQ